MTNTPTIPVDFEAVKSKQQATWSSGDYAVIGSTLQITGESLCEALDVSAGHRVLDVAAGNGNASLAAVRRGCEVVAADYVPSLLAGAAARAAADGFEIETREADAEALPFSDGSFDAVVSTFGVMFSPDQARAAAELCRVCRSGGRIGLANWTPDGFVGQMLATVGKYVPPPAGVRSPVEWGRVDRLGELFDGHHLQVDVRQFVFRYRSAEHWLDTFRSFYGPTFKAFGAVEEPQRSAFARELLDLAEAHNTATDGTLRVPSDYLEVVVTVR
jgi:SAM-dependent methyltransferase